MIENKVEKSGLITIDLVDLIPSGQQYVIDLKDFMFEGLILREKDFREQLKKKDWSVYKEGFVAVTNSSEGIVPLWAYMLITSGGVISGGRIYWERYQASSRIQDSVARYREIGRPPVIIFLYDPFASCSYRGARSASASSAELRR